MKKIVIKEIVIILSSFFNIIIINFLYFVRIRTFRFFKMKCMAIDRKTNFREQRNTIERLIKESNSTKSNRNRGRKFGRRFRLFEEKVSNVPRPSVIF